MPVGTAWTYGDTRCRDREGIYCDDNTTHRVIHSFFGVSPGVVYAHGDAISSLNSNPPPPTTLSNEPIPQCAGCHRSIASTGRRRTSAEHGRRRTAQKCSPSRRGWRGLRCVFGVVTAALICDYCHCYCCVRRGFTLFVGFSL